ncbi:hypothetical protein QQF64_023743 [Cirrhinus molitorella]|uniref:SAP domain-containing protein n=1 Tax=Cirrhinus molitorella TaxID=172907 RepID=A0ABR3NJF6_9TELE
MDECVSSVEFATRSGFQHFECIHLKSLQFCPWPSRIPVVLDEDVLEDMIAANVFGEQTKTTCVATKAAAIAAGVPLSVELNIGGPLTKKYISVYEPKVSYYSRLGRVIASYDSTRNTWHCPCAKPRRSCLHKNIARWHLFQLHRQLFVSSPIDRTAQNLAQEHASQKSSTLEYPPSGEGLKRMVRYLMKNKTLPAELPQKCITGSMTISDIPKHLVPKETVCSECPGNVALRFSTYYQMCSNCGLKYRYQEWTDGLHNFNDHLLISLHMCIILRHSLQTHHAISRAVEVLETTAQKKFPSKDKILHAYMHFEALTDHEYTYSCVKCGYHPAVVVMDLHKKAAFNMPVVSDIPAPPPEYDGRVNMKDFWESVTAEIVCRGLLGSDCQNPFLVSPSYDYWAPWIGPRTRKEDTVLNTEYAKMHATRPATGDAELEVTEERLEELLTNLKVDVVRRLCKQCGLDPSGSKMDLVVRLRQEMRNRSSYDKVFQKVWGASAAMASDGTPAATASDGTPAATASDGTPAATASDGTPAATASDGTPAATASDGTPAATARLMYAEREIQDFRLWGCPKTLTLLNHYQQMQHLKTASYFQYGHLDIGTCVMIATKLVAGNWQLIKNKDIPSQKDSLNCGVFMLMYALYITFEWPFDFTQSDMPYIRECWLNLVLKCMSHKREAPSLEEDQVNYMYGCFKDHGILALPAFVLEDIFINVVLQEGDEAILTLALVCTHFRDLVTREAFRRRAHFLWLDSVTNWSAFSSYYKAEFYKMYRLETCVQCGDTFKNCIPGYVGRGEEGNS